MREAQIPHWSGTCISLEQVKILATSTDTLVVARLLHPPSGGSGVVPTTPFFLPEIQPRLMTCPDDLSILPFIASFGL